VFDTVTAKVNILQKLSLLPTFKNQNVVNLILPYMSEWISATNSTWLVWPNLTLSLMLVVVIYRKYIARKISLWNWLNFSQVKTTLKVKNLFFLLKSFSWLVAVSKCESEHTSCVTLSRSIVPIWCLSTNKYIQDEKSKETNTNKVKQTNTFLSKLFPGNESPIFDLSRVNVDATIA
jgi:hypothetical protein